MDDKRRKEVAKWTRDLIISVVLVPAILAYFQMNAPVIAACAVGSLLLLAAWENQFRFVSVVAAVALASAAIGWDYWYYSEIIHGISQPPQTQSPPEARPQEQTT